MALYELALLFPPMARFFIGLLLIFGVVSAETLFALFVYTRLYDRD